MSTPNSLELSDAQVGYLLQDMDRYHAETIHPLSDEDIAAIEAKITTEPTDVEREARQLQYLEMLRQEWLAERQAIAGLRARGREVGLPLPALAQRLRLDPGVIATLDLHLVKDVPRKALEALADALQLDLASIYAYLFQPAPTLDKVAAASEGQPAPGAPQSWAEVIQSSSMSSEDKAYWLDPKAI